MSSSHQLDGGIRRPLPAREQGLSDHFEQPLQSVDMLVGGWERFCNLDELGCGVIPGFEEPFWKLLIKVTRCVRTWLGCEAFKDKLRKGPLFCHLHGHGRWQTGDDEPGRVVEKGKGQPF